MNVLLGLVLVYVLITGIAYYTKPPVAKWLMFGSARLLGLPMQATVYFNERLQPDVKVYRINRHYNGSRANQYLLYQPLKNGGHLALYIDMQLRDAGIGNSAAKDYATIGSLLFQAENAAWFVPFKDSVKGAGFDCGFATMPGNVLLDVPAGLTPAYPDLQHVRVRFY